MAKGEIGGEMGNVGLSMLLLYDYFFCFALRDVPERGAEVDDPVNCEGCRVDLRLDFMDRRRHDNHRLAMFFDKIDKNGRAQWGGDRDSDEYHYPSYLSSPFSKEDPSRGRGRVDILETGSGIEHTCPLIRVPRAMAIWPFLPRGRKKEEAGAGGYEVTLRFHLGGMVDQSPGGRWEWTGQKTAELKVPDGLQRIFGRCFNIDGWFRVVGEAASRRKKRTVEFRERQKGSLLENVPSSTHVTVEWEDWLVPAPCFGITLWLICAEVIEWRPVP